MRAGLRQTEWRRQRLILDLQQNRIAGKFVPFLTNVSTLTKLDISGDFPGFFGELKSLKFLSIGGNNFSSSIPLSFGNLTLLKSLNLGGNHLIGVFPDELMLLINLSSLNLSGNKFSGRTYSSEHWEFEATCSFESE